MRWVLPILALILCGASAPPLNTPVVTLDQDIESHWVPFEWTPGNQIRFRLEINGHPANAILDTGVSHSVISVRFARQARLRISGRGKASAVGGDVTIGWTRPTHLKFGGLMRQGGRLAVTALPSIAAGGEPIDALIGGDLLSCCALDIDYDARRFRMLRSGRMPFAGQRVPLSLAPDSDVYISQVDLGGHPVRPVMVDTGDGSSLTVTQDAWSHSPWHNVPTSTTIGYGLGGTIVTGLAIAPKLMLNSLPLDNVEIRIDGPNGFTTQTGMQGRIGSGLLRRFRVLLDPRAGQMILKPGRRYEQQALRSTSGLLLGREPGRLRVMHVMRGSPAAADGWRTGDQICAVDGDAVTSEKQINSAMSQLNGKPGSIVALRLCDGNARALKLAKFY